MRNRIKALGDIEDSEAGHDEILSTYRNLQLNMKKLYKTREKIKERKEAKLKMEGARSERLKQK